MTAHGIEASSSAEGNAASRSGNLPERIREGSIRILEPCPVGALYPAGRGYARQTFCLIVSLEEPVNLPALRVALSETGTRFPMVRRGLLRIGTEYYCIENLEPPSVGQAAHCIRIGGEENGYRAFDVSAGERKITISVDHALMDGGALLRVTDYLMFRYRVNLGSAQEAAFSDSCSLSPEEADPYLLPYEGEWIPPLGISGTPWHPPYGGVVSSDLIQLTIPTRQVLSLCKTLSTSPSVLVVLLLHEAFGRVFPEAKECPFVVNLPMDYRNVMGASGTLKNASFPFFFDVNGEEWKDLDFGGKARAIRERIRQHRDVRYARGWLRFQHDFRMTVNRLAEKKEKPEKPMNDPMFLSYLRPSADWLYEGMKLTYTGVSSMSADTMLEYGGNFHIWIRPVSHEGFLPALRETFSAHGLSMTDSREEDFSQIAEVPALGGEELGPFVFFFFNPFWGEVNPILSLVSAFAGRGFQVRVYTGERMRDKLEAAGAVCIPCDAFYNALHAPEYASDGFLRMMELARSMDAMLGMDVGALKPLCAIVDTQAIWGRLLAAKHGLKVILSSATQVRNLFTLAEDWGEYLKKLEPWEEEIEKMLSSLAGKGFPKSTLLSLLCPGKDTAVIAHLPEFMQSRLDTFPGENLYFTGYSRYLEKRGDSKQPEKQPGIYVTLGEYFGHAPGFFRNCVEALRAVEADVVLDTCEFAEPGRCWSLPRHIRIAREHEREEILGRADLAVSHAGMGMISDCLMLGVPMVVFPREADQFGNAKRVAELGVGVFVPEDRPELIRQAVETVLADPGYRKRALQLGNRMRRGQGSQGAVDWIKERWMV